MHAGEGCLSAPALSDATSLTAGELRAVAALWSAQKREVVARFGGSSMRPSIAPGQAVVVRWGDRAHVGDVAVFQRGDVLTVHRVVAEHEGFLLTWGDGNFIPDDPVDAKHLLGVVVALHRDGAREPVPPAGNPRWRRALLHFLLPAPERMPGRFGGRVVRLRLLTGVLLGRFGPLLHRVKARVAS